MRGSSRKPHIAEQIVNEASAWFVEFRFDDVPADGRERFDEWLRRSPEHVRAYIEIARTYVVLPTLDPDYKVDVAQLIAYACADGNVVALSPSAAQPSRRETATGTAPRIRPSPRWLSAAAIAACLVGMVAWTLLTRFPIYTTGVGERRSITLPDGSTVELNAQSTVRVEMRKSRREVDLLEGQAFFEVAKDTTRPFFVRSRDLRVQAVGTQFDVDRKRDSTTVTVVEGRVAVITPEHQPASIGNAVAVPGAARRGALAAHVDLLGVPLKDGVSVLLAAGEQLIVTGAGVAPPRHVNLAVATAWLQHRFIFNGSPLREVVEQFNRYNARQIVIADPELADYHISGVYSSTDPASLIRFLRSQPGLAVIETGNSFRVERR